jgi:anti-sigma factor RsiW
MRIESKSDIEFDEELLSGYLDGALVQQQEQRVRIALERSAEARALLEELRQMREAALSTPFAKPQDMQWSEAPRSGLSRWSRGFGWLFVLLWSIGLSAYGLWEFSRDSDSLLEKMVVFGALGGVALLLSSVALDRRRVAKDDPYRGVER